jgi:hypothetical protein
MDDNKKKNDSANANAKKSDRTEFADEINMNNTKNTSANNSK